MVSGWHFWVFIVGGLAIMAAAPALGIRWLLNRRHRGRRVKLAATLVLYLAGGSVVILALFPMTSF